MLSKYDNITSQTTYDMADALASFMAASYNLLEDKYLDSDTNGSNFQKFMNTFSIEIDNARAFASQWINTNIDMPNFMYKCYILGISSDINVIDDVIIDPKTLVKSEYIYDFIYGAPVVEEFIVVGTQTFDLTYTVANNHNGEYVISSVSSAGQDLEYSVGVSGDTNILSVYTSLNPGDVVRISYRTDDTYYHDDKYYTAYFRKEYSTIQINANNKLYGPYSNTYQHYWNNLDGIGLLCDTYRLNDESDAEFRERIRNAYIYPPSQNIAGIRNVVAQKLGLIKQETWPIDKNPLTLYDIWEDSLRIDKRPLDHYSFDLLGISVTDEIVEGSLRVFRNGLLRHECSKDSNNEYVIDGDYKFINGVIIFIDPVTSIENIVMDYMLKNGIYQHTRTFKVDASAIDGAVKRFDLPEIQIIGKTQVYHNSLRDSAGADYDEYYGYIEFLKPPPAGDSIIITYYTEADDVHFEYYNHQCSSDTNGTEDTFTIPEKANFLWVFVNGTLKYLTDDYEMIDDTTFHLFETPDEHSRVDITYLIHNSNETDGAEFEQLEFQVLPGGSYRWNIGSLYPNTKYRNLKLKLQYNGQDTINFRDIWLTSSVASRTLYAMDELYANTYTYTNDVKDYLLNTTTTSIEELVPERDGWSTYIKEAPDKELGYIPMHPEFQINTSIQNLDTPAGEKVWPTEYIQYNINVRNIGDTIAHGCYVTIHPPAKFTLYRINANQFQLQCDMPRGLSRDIRYILTSRWDNDKPDAINVYPIWDEHFAPRLLYDEDGLPTQQLETFVNKINSMIPILWNNGHWDESIWDSYDNCYGDINLERLYDVETYWQTTSANDASRFNYSFLPHKWDQSLDNFVDTKIDGINRKLDFQSGIGYDTDLEMEIKSQEYELLSSQRHYKCPVYVNPGKYYVNSYIGTQYAKPGIQLILGTSLGADNSYPLSFTTSNFYGVIDILGTLYKCRKTLFFENGNRTHVNKETVYGNGINTALNLTYKDIEIVSVKDIETNQYITNFFYNVIDNKVILTEFAVGVTITPDEEVLIDTERAYEVKYTLLNSYYYDDINNIVYFKEAYDSICLFYEMQEGEKFNTGIIANPLYSPHTKKFIYGDIERPIADGINCWCSPYNAKQNGDLIFITAEVLSKYGTPIKDADVTFTSQLGNNSMKTNEFGRCVYIIRTNTQITGEVTFTATCGNKTSSCKINIYR